MSSMAPIEAQRTLVKSPPELWAELSDPASLARHLSPFGEIRIARVEPEKSVEWEADTVAGSVELKPSGWGTKVTLTVVREPPEAAAVGPVALEPEPAAELAASPEPTAEPGTSPEPTAEPGTSPEPTAEPGTSPEPTAEPGTSPEPAAEPGTSPEPAGELEVGTEPAAELEGSPEPPAIAESVPEEGLESQPTTRRSRFLARFLRRRWGRTVGTRQHPAAEAEQHPIAEAEQPPTPATEKPPAAEAGQPRAVEAEPPPPEAAHAQVPPPNLAAELAAELARMEEAMVEQDTALLSAVLDRLGAAHHRPFSRS